MKWHLKFGDMIAARIPTFTTVLRVGQTRCSSLQMFDSALHKHHLKYTSFINLHIFLWFNTLVETLWSLNTVLILEASEMPSRLNMINCDDNM